MTYVTNTHARPQFDDWDQDIFEARLHAYNSRIGYPRVGDYVEFRDGVRRRISYVWEAEANPSGENEYQTSDGGSWYLDVNGRVGFSGALHGPVPESSLTLMPLTRQASFWFFHHDYYEANNDVTVTFGVRVYACSLHSSEVV